MSTIRRGRVGCFLLGKGPIRKKRPEPAIRPPRACSVEASKARSQRGLESTLHFMLRTPARRVVLLLACALTAHLRSPPEAAAQGFEPVGTRAQGMAGAFVAVADDASGTYWNPAGLASIPVFDASLAFTHLEQSHEGGDSGGARAPAWRTRNSGFALALPVLGVSYYRLRTVRAQSSPYRAVGRRPTRGEYGVRGRDRQHMEPRRHAGAVARRRRGRRNARCAWSGPAPPLDPGSRRR